MSKEYATQHDCNHPKKDHESWSLIVSNIVNGQDDHFDRLDICQERVESKLDTTSNCS